MRSRGLAAVALAVVIVSMALVALAAPASAVPTESLSLNLTEMFGWGIQTELVALDLTGNSAVQSQPGPSQGPIHVAGMMDVHYRLMYTDLFGNHFKEGDLSLDSFFDVTFAVAIGPGAERSGPASAIALDVKGSMPERYSPLDESPYFLDVRAAYETSLDWSHGFGTGATRIGAESFFDVFFELSTDAGPVAAHEAQSRLDAVVGQPGPVQTPTAQADSFFDVTFDVAHPPNPNAPATASSDSFFDVFADVTRTAQNSPLDVQDGAHAESHVGISPGPQQDVPAVQQVRGRVDNSERASVMIPPLTTVLAADHGTSFDFVQKQPGPISVPVDSFFDVFFEVEAPRGGMAMYAGRVELDDTLLSTLTMLGDMMDYHFVLFDAASVPMLLQGP